MQCVDMLIIDLDQPFNKPEKNTINEFKHTELY